MVETMTNIQARQAEAGLEESVQGHAGRVGDDIVIDFRQMPRLQAVQQVAALTDAQLLAGRDLLARASPVTLQWRGRDAVQAWQRVLGDNIRHSVHCDADGCRVWVLALKGPEGALFTNVESLDGSPDPQGTAIHAVIDPLQAQPEARIGPMNTPTLPDESDQSGPDTESEATAPTESGFIPTT